MYQNPSKLIRIVIIDSDILIRSGLGLIIESQQDMCIVGVAGDRENALAIVESQNPDIILLKLNTQKNMGSDIIQKLQGKSNHSRIILLSRQDEAETNVSALVYGALGIVFTTDPPEILVKAIKKVNVGEVWIERSLMANVLNGLTNNHGRETDPEMEKISELTDRERDVVLLIGRGLRNKQIAKQLHLSETTIRHHLTSIYSKLGVTNRLELLVFATRHSLV
jgi:two-component system nitrate/nitrite response regulator NarL